MKRLLLPVVLLAVLPAGCGEEFELQDELKGLWILESRVLASGRKLSPPEVSARVEWFDMENRMGHFSYMATYGLDDTQILGAHYTFREENAFEREVYLDVGGGIRGTYVPGYETPHRTDRGTVERNGSRIALRHENGLSLVFEGNSLTLTHPDGTVDVLRK